MSSKAENPNNDGWIEWHGGDRPVAFDTLVEVRYLAPPRPGQGAIHECFAGFFAWHHTDENDDIIAYRVAEVQP